MTQLTLRFHLLRPLVFSRRGLGILLVAFSVLTVLYFQLKPGSADAGGPQLTPISWESHAASLQLKEPLHGTAAIDKSIELLEAGLTRMQDHPVNTALFVKRANIYGRLESPEMIEIKSRQIPYGLYLKWLSGDDAGQEILLDPTHYEGHMLVRLSGLKGRLLPALKIDPFGSRALKRSRHPVTEITLVKLTERMLKRQKIAKTLGKQIECEVRADGVVDGRPCYTVIDRYQSSSADSEYQQVQFLIDQEQLIPIAVRAWVWPAEGAQTKELDDCLVEDFEYRQVDLTAKLTDADFDEKNTAYRFRR